MGEIVFLNMADDLHVDGHKAVQALKIKHPDSGIFNSKEHVEEVLMVPVYRAWKNGAPMVKEMAKVKKKVSAAKKVMLSIHGGMKDIDDVVIHNPTGGNDEAVTYQELGAFLLELFDKDKCHNFTLVTCFAARSSAYLVDHQSLALVNWTDSFAYKLYNELCPGREVRMTARTGELSFNTATGASEVQTELSIRGTVDNESILAEEAVVKSQKWWNDNVGRLTTDNASRTFQFVIDLTMANNRMKPSEKLADLRQLKVSHGLLAKDGDRAKCLKYLDHLIRLTEASSRQADPVNGKYGKMIYRYFHGIGICVFSKYPVPMMVHPTHRAIDPALLKKFSKKG